MKALYVSPSVRILPIITTPVLPPFLRTLPMKAKASLPSFELAYPLKPRYSFSFLTLTTPCPPSTTYVVEFNFTKPFMTLSLVWFPETSVTLNATTIETLTLTVWFPTLVNASPLAMRT